MLCVHYNTKKNELHRVSISMQNHVSFCEMMWILLTRGSFSHSEWMGIQFTEEGYSEGLNVVRCVDERNQMSVGRFIQMTVRIVSISLI